MVADGAAAADRRRRRPQAFGRFGRGRGPVGLFQRPGRARPSRSRLERRFRRLRRRLRLRPRVHLLLLLLLLGFFATVSGLFPIIIIFFFFFSFSSFSSSSSWTRRAGSAGSVRPTRSVRRSRRSDGRRAVGRNRRHVPATPGAATPVSTPTLLLFLLCLLPRLQRQSVNLDHVPSSGDWRICYQISQPVRGQDLNKKYYL